MSDAPMVEIPIEAPENLIEMVIRTAPGRPVTLRLTHWEDGYTQIEVWHRFNDESGVNCRWYLIGKGKGLEGAIRASAGWERFQIDDEGRWIPCAL